jgi:hypothetical protein
MFEEEDDDSSSLADGVISGTKIRHLQPGETYAGDERQTYWDAIEHSIDQIGAADGDSSWYDGEGTQFVGGGIPDNATMRAHFFDTHGEDSHYQSARDLFSVYEAQIRGDSSSAISLRDIAVSSPANTSAEDLTVLLADLGLSTEQWSDEFLGNFGKTAGEMAESLYPTILAEKRRGDARWQLDAPAGGSAEDLAGKWGKLSGDPGKAALAALDKCAGKVVNGDYSGCKPGGIEDIEEGTGADDETRTLGFKEQCFLLSKVSTVASYKAAPPDKDPDMVTWKRWPYKPSIWSDIGTNACIQVQCDPFTFINELAVYPDTQKFLTMPSEEIANLQPIIRFYKVIQPDSGGEIQIPIHFDTDSGLDLRNFMKGGSRNIGVGIQDFQVKFQGTNPFAAKKDLTAKLTIFASSFAELVRPKNSFTIDSNGNLGPYQKFQYVDLALKTDSKISLNAQTAPASTNVVSGLNFSIRAVVGVNKPGKTIGGAGNGLEGALSRNFVTLEMIPTVHSFDFNEDGSVKFEINYKPFVNENFSSTTYDVFATKEITKFLLGSDIISTSIMQNCDIKTAADFRRSQVEKIKDIQRNAIQSLIKSVTDQGLMRYLWIPPALLKKINREGPLFDMEELAKEKVRIQTQKGKALSTKIADRITNSKKPGAKAPIAAAAISPNSSGLQFIYLSDLLDVMLSGIDQRMRPDNINAMLNEMIQENYGKLSGFNWKSPETMSLIDGAKKSYIREYKKFQKLRIVLGPIELVDPISPASVKIVNLGDLPVSVKYFTEFLTAEVLKKGRRQFPLDQFVDKLINKMISSFLNNDSCFNGSVKQRTFFRRTSFVAYANPADSIFDPLSGRLLRSVNDMSKYTRIVSKNIKGAPPLLNTVGSIGNRILNKSEKTYMYSVFYTANTLPIGMFTGDQALDAARGIHHYAVGRDTGIIKEIKLIRDKRTGIAEARYAQDGFNGLTQLREMYHVEVTTVANMSVYPGMKIFVDPQGWVPKMDAEIIDALGKYTNLTDYGIGGYYDVTEVEHFFGPGNFETKFTAKWTAQIATANTPAAASAAAATAPAKKCAIFKHAVVGAEKVDDEIPKVRSAALEESYGTSTTAAGDAAGPSAAPQ